MQDGVKGFGQRARLGRDDFGDLNRMGRARRLIAVSVPCNIEPTCGHYLSLALVLRKSIVRGTGGCRRTRRVGLGRGVAGDMRHEWVRRAPGLPRLPYIMLIVPLHGHLHVHQSVAAEHCHSSAFLLWQ